MRHLDQTLSAFSALEQALSSEVGRVEQERELLRHLEAQKLLDSSREGTRFNERLQGLLTAARESLAQLCAEAGAETASTEALERVAPALAAKVKLAVDGARGAGHRLQAAQAFNRDVTTRALSLVRALEQRLPVSGAVYGRAGRALAGGRPVTTSRRA